MTFLSCSDCFNVISPITKSPPSTEPDPRPCFLTSFSTTPIIGAVDAPELFSSKYFETSEISTRSFASGDFSASLYAFLISNLSEAALDLKALSTDDPVCAEL